MKKLFFIFLLIPSLSICQQDLKKSQQVQIEELKYQVNQLAETERQRKIELLEARIEQATTTIQNQSSTIENFDNFYTCISILIGLLAIGIPLGTFLIAIRPARQAIAAMQDQVSKQLDDHESKNQNSLDQLGIEIGKQLADLSNQYSEQLAEMNSNFADSNKALDEKYENKASELKNDYELKTERIESNFWNHMGRIEAFNDNSAGASAYIIIAMIHGRRGPKRSMVGKLNNLSKQIVNVKSKEDAVFMMQILSGSVSNGNIDFCINFIDEIQFDNIGENKKIVIDQLQLIKAWTDDENQNSA